MAMVAKSMEAAVNSLEDFVSMADFSQRDPLSEDMNIHALAIEAIEKDEGFSVEDFVDAVLVITDKPFLAKAYLLINGKEARTSFLLSHMEKLRNKGSGSNVQ